MAPTTHLTTAALLLALLSSLATRPVAADELVDLVRPTPGISTRDHIEKRLQLGADVLSVGIGGLSLGLLELRSDVAGRRARIGIGGGDASVLRLRLDSNVFMVGDRAEVRSRIDFSINGHRFDLELPDITLVPRGLDGGSQIQIPIIQQRF